MPGQCGLHGDGGGFGVADFADQDDVRVLAHDGAQPVGEGQPDFGIDLYLTHTFQFVFNRIFDGQDVLVRRGQFLKHGIERGGLAAAGGAGDQHDAVRDPHEGMHELQVFPAEPEFGEGKHALAFFEQTEHHAFAEGRGQGGHAQPRLTPAEGNGDAPVLRQTLFRDVEFRHDLDARHHGGVMGLVQGMAFIEHAVQPEAYAGNVAVGFDVDVAGPGAHGLREDHVDQPDERGFAAVLQQVLHRVFVEFVDRIDRIAEHVRNAPFRAGGLSENPVDDVRDVVFAGKHGVFKPFAEQHPQLLCEKPAGRVADRQRKFAVLVADGHHLLFSEPRQRNLADAFGVRGPTGTFLVHEGCEPQFTGHGMARRRGFQILVFVDALRLVQRPFEREAQSLRVSCAGLQYLGIEVKAFQQ